jgi:hypothetical protein
MAPKRRGGYPHCLSTLRRWDDAPVVPLLVIIGTLLICIPNGVLLKATREEIPVELAACCKNSSIPCIVQQKTLEAVFGTTFKGALILSIVATVLTALFLMQWHFRPHLSPSAPELLVHIMWTIAVFSSVVSFAFVIFAVRFSTSELVGCVPFSKHSLLATGWIQCLCVAFISVCTTYIIPRIKPATAPAYATVTNTTATATPAAEPFVIDDA